MLDDEIVVRRPWYNGSDAVSDNYIFHHGIKGQKWGVRNGPPYPLNTSASVSKRSYAKINAIYKSMSSKDRKLIDPNSQDGDDYYESYSDYKNRTAYNGLTSDGFVVAEKIDPEDNVDGTTGIEIGIGVLNKGQGTGSRLASELVDWFNNQDEYDTMWWPVDKKNVGSIALAEKHGFIKDPLGENYIYAKDQAFRNLGIVPDNVDILRNYDGPAYFISTDSNLRNLKPRVPKNFFTENGYEDSETSRVSFAPSIDKCLAGLSQNVEGKSYSVYEPADISRQFVCKPNEKAVPDSAITDELWILNSVKLRKVGTIKVTGNRGENGQTFQYGDHEAELYDDWTYDFNKIEHSESTLFGDFVYMNRN